MLTFIKSEYFSWQTYKAKQNYEKYPTNTLSNRKTFSLQGKTIKFSKTFIENLNPAAVVWVNTWSRIVNYPSQAISVLGTTGKEGTNGRMNQIERTKNIALVAVWLFRRQINDCSVMAQFPFALEKLMWNGKRKGRVFFLLNQLFCVLNF